MHETQGFLWAKTLINFRKKREQKKIAIFTINIRQVHSANITTEKKAKKQEEKKIEEEEEDDEKYTHKY